MALFGGSKNKVKKEKKKKGSHDGESSANSKESKRGRGRKGKSLVERMKLSEVVASMALSDLEQFDPESPMYSNTPSAVRLVDDGYTLIVVTDQMLQEAGLTGGDDSYGSFAESIRSEHIKTVLLKEDLENGILALVPDEDTLSLLDEFSFAAELNFPWAILPIDADDSSRVTILDNTVTLAELIDIMNNELALDLIDNTLQVKVDGYADDDQEVYQEPVQEEAPVSLNQETQQQSYDQPTQDYGNPVDYQENQSFVPETYQEPGYQSDEMFNQDGYDNYNQNDAAFGQEQYPAVQDQSFGDNFNEDYVDSFEDDAPFDPSTSLIDLSGDDAADVLNQVIQRDFYNDELGISVKNEIFDVHFDNKDTLVPLFNTTPTDDSELSRNVAKMREDANAELLRVHNDHIQKLRSQYNLAAASMHDKLVEILDYRDSKTAYGQQYNDIQAERLELLDSADDSTLVARQELEDEYNRKRDEAANRAFEDAKAKYDEHNRDDLDRAKANIGDTLIAGINADQDGKISDMYDQRRVTAARLFDKATTGILIKLQDQYKDFVKQELRLQDALRHDIDAYIRQNYTDDILRAKALAEQLRQKHEAEEVRQSYEQMLHTKEQELNEVRTRNNNEVMELRARHQQTLDKTITEWNEKVDELREDRDKQTKAVERLQADLVELDKRKEEEYASRISTINNQNQALTDQLKYTDERNARSNKLQIVLMTAVALVAASVGIFGGAMWASSRVSTQPAPVIQNLPADVTPPIAGGNTYNYNYAGDKEKNAKQTPESSEADNENGETAQARDSDQIEGSRVIEIPQESGDKK